MQLLLFQKIKKIHIPILNHFKLGLSLLVRAVAAIIFVFRFFFHHHHHHRLQNEK